MLDCRHIDVRSLSISVATTLSTCVSQCTVLYNIVYRILDLTRDWSILGPHHLDEFVRLWADYDPDATYALNS